ncbi:MAG TPA: NAD(P)H-quinone oxidoreductase [Actinomycetes bacterium]|nr:NAD(P)H-quinone oxidoreductase [Actinomycetes bacterium]
MRAVVVTKPGPPSVLAIQEVEPPDLLPGQVVVDVVAAGVNRADLLQRQGNYSPPPGASPWPGLECSGRISAVSEDVSGWQVGDEVAALLSGGGYAEQVAVPVGQLMTRPEGVDLISAAALPEVVCTVWSNVFDVGRLAPGETLLVHGGGSGIGTMAIQLGKVFGAEVIVTCGSSDKADACLALGADVAINYRDEDFVEVVKAATEGRGADVILDVVGAKYLVRNVDALAMHGRLVVIGLQGGVKAELDLGRLMAKRAAIYGTMLRSRPVHEKSTIVTAVVDHVWPLIAAGEVRPVVDRVIDWNFVADAHQAMEAGDNFGKILLRVGPGDDPATSSPNDSTPQ